MQTSNQTFATFVDKIVIDATAIVLPLLFSLALLYFMYGIFKFIKSSGAGDEKGRDEGKKAMVAGVIGLAVMVSVWGLVAMVAGTIGGGLILPQIR